RRWLDLGRCTAARGERDRHSVEEWFSEHERPICANELFLIGRGDPTRVVSRQFDHGSDRFGWDVLPGYIHHVRLQRELIRRFFHDRDVRSGCDLFQWRSYLSQGAFHSGGWHRQIVGRWHLP